MRVCTVARETVWELTRADLKNEARLRHVAARAALGDLVYCPPQNTPPMLESRATRPDARGASFYADPPPVRMHTERPDSHRVDLLRVALRARGQELFDEGAYFWRIGAR